MRKLDANRSTYWMFTLLPRLSTKAQHRLLTAGLVLSLLATPAAAYPTPPISDNPYNLPVVQQAIDDLGLNAPDSYGQQFQVNSYQTESQYDPAVDMDGDGDFVVVWASNGSSGGDTSGWSIQGQRFDSAGTPQGSQFQVNTYTTNNQHRPVVAIDDNGNFVVAWESASSGGDSSGRSIHARRFDSTGAPQGGQFQVNSYTTGEQRFASVSMDSDGDFVVVWNSYGSAGGDSSQYSVQGQRYDSAGTPQGSQFQINSYTTGSQTLPDVALDSNGDFVIIWQSYGSNTGDSSAWTVQGQRYNNLGVAQGSQFQINSYTTSSQRYPSVSVDDDGDFVAVWSSLGSDGGDTAFYSIQGQRFDNAGTPQGSQFQINSYTTDSQSFPEVTLDSDGDFVVSWQSYGSQSSDNFFYSVQAQTFNSSGQALWGQFQVNSNTLNNQVLPVITSDDSGDFVVVWASYSSSGGDNFPFSIQANQFSASQVNHQINAYTTNNQIMAEVATDSDGDFVVVWQSFGSDGGDTFGYSIQGQRFNKLGLRQGNQFQINSYSTGNQQNVTVAMDSDGDFVVVWQSFGSDAGDISGYSIQGQRYNNAGTPQGDNFQINTYTTNTQSNPQVAMDDSGNFVVVWQSVGADNGDPLGGSIQGQRYNSAGTPQGSQFLVNSYTTGNQAMPDVDLDSNGDFVVVWHSAGSAGTDSSAYSIQGQRYNSAGTPQGSQFQVNSYTTNLQQFASVSLDSDGDFVVVWDSNDLGGSDTAGYGVRGQRYNSAGTPQGSEFQVNTYTTNNQRYPSVSLDSDGDFVIAWQSFGSASGDISGYSIQTRQYTKTGATQGNQFQTNTYTFSSQQFAHVALDSDGDFVVVWNSQGSAGGGPDVLLTTDTSGDSIAATRFNALAGPVPTAVTLSNSRVEADWSVLPAILTALLATLTSLWLWLQRKK